MKLADLNFFLVGAARAGTTSMWDLLVRTPGVYLPRQFFHKEPAYFSRLTGLDSHERYLELFGGVDDESHRVRGEASTAYLTDPAAAGRIANAAPDARILILLRDPADRAYSLYNWMAQEGYEWAGTFEEALRREPERASSDRFRDNCSEYFYNYLYVRSSRYADQVARYLRHFGQERVHVVLFEDFVGRPRETYRGVLDFLGVPVPEPLPKPRVRNPSRRPYSPRLQRVLRLLTRWRRRLRPGRPASKASRDSLLEWGLTGEQPPPLPPGLRRRIQEACRDDIRRLEKIIDRDLTSWTADR